MERSFKEEVGKLQLGDGDIFHGEGILAVTKALLQSGVAYVGGYQGAPVSHMMDVLNDARDIMDDLGIHIETNASEAGAAAMLSASINYPVRGCVTFKSIVGTNVASDALSNLSSAGVIGGAVIVLGEDYGEGASIIQERSHAFAMKSQMWLLDPRPNLPKIVDSVEKAFQLSEASNTPVLLELRIRACHVQGTFATRDNRAAPVSRKHVLENPDFDYSRICLPPATYAQEKHKIDVRWPAAVKFIRDHKLNETFAGDADDVGIICQGGMYNVTIRSLQQLGLADAFGESRIPIYCMNVTYPMIPEEVSDFCAGKRAVLVVEEGHRPTSRTQCMRSCVAPTTPARRSTARQATTTMPAPCRRTPGCCPSRANTPVRSCSQAWRSLWRGARRKGSTPPLRWSPSIRSRRQRSARWNCSAARCPSARPASVSGALSVPCSPR